MPSKGRVMVAMSGGVDSSVAAVPAEVAGLRCGRRDHEAVERRPDRHPWPLARLLHHRRRGGCPPRLPDHRRAALRDELSGRIPRPRYRLLRWRVPPWPDSPSMPGLQRQDQVRLPNESGRRAGSGVRSNGALRQARFLRQHAARFSGAWITGRTSRTCCSA